MNKKSQADLTVGTIVEFILLAVVIIVMLMRISQEASSHRFDKKFLSKDIGMFIDALYTSPNKIVVKYPQNSYDYSFVFGESKVTVFWQTEGEKLGESYYFTENPNIEFGYKTISNNPSAEKVIEGTGEQQIGLPIIFVKSKKHIEPFFGLIIGEKT